MKALLEFDLPEEDIAHLWAINSHHAWSALSEIRLAIRAHNKYGGTTAQQLIDQISHIVIEAESFIGE